MQRLLARFSPLALVAATLSALPLSPALATPAPAVLSLQGDAIGDSTMAAELGLLFSDAFDSAMPDACDVAAGLQGYGVAVDSSRFCFNPSSPAFIPDLTLQGMCRSLLAPAGAPLVDVAVSRTSAWSLDLLGMARGCVYPSGTANNFKSWASAYKSALIAYRKQGFEAAQSALATCDDSAAVNACMVKDLAGQWVPDPGVFKPLAPPPLPTQASATSVTISQVASMAAGASSQVFIKFDGGVVARCDATLPSTPSSVCSPPSTLGTAVRVAAAGRHMAALKTDGSVAQWGSINVNGVSTSARPPAITDAVDIAIGDDFAAALLANGTVTAWGDNSLAQTSVPSGLSQVTRISAGRCHVVALREDGTLVSWGCANAGQTSVAALSGVVNVKAVGDATIAQFADGSSTIIGNAVGGPQVLAGTAALSAATGPYFTSGNDCQTSVYEFSAKDAGTATSISAPTSLSVVTSPLESGVWRFTWSAPTNADTKPGYTYEARYSASNGRLWTDWVDVTSPAEFPKPDNGVVARFDVRAVYRNSLGSWVPGPKSHMVIQETIICGGNQSSDVTASLVRTETAPPAAPAAVTWVSNSPKTLRIGFAANPAVGVGSSRAESVTYSVRYSATGGAWISVPVRGFAASISGLTGGASYQVQVSATTSLGTATTTVTAKTVTDAVVPSVAATSISGRAVTLTWKPGVLPAGSKDKVTDYRIEYSTDGVTWVNVAHKASTKPTLAVTGLRAATDYQFRVSAVASSGTGAPTTPISVTTTAAVPMPATALALGLRNATSVTAAWQPPSDAGGLPITGYTITTVPAGGVASIDGTSAVISGLTAGKVVTVNVTARNALGASVATAAKITVMGPASAPAVTVQRLSSSVIVTWKAPTSTGGGKVTGYIVTRQPDGVPMVVVGTKATLTGLTRGDVVTVSIAAVTAFGPGTAAVTVVSPLDVPGSVRSLTYASKDTNNWNISWLAPQDTGGSTIKGYRVSISKDGGVSWSAPTAVTKSPYVLAKSAGATRIVKVWTYNAIGDGPPTTVTLVN